MTSDDAAADGAGTDACADVSCDAPPAPTCLDSTTLTSYAASGTCANGQCTYARTYTVCMNGCSGAACAGHDPCAGVTCNSPPAPSCTDASTLESWSASGTCSGGACSYSSTSVTCANGCQSGACKGDPCAGVTCDQPPATTCVTSAVLRSYSAAGTCSAGACSYASTDTVCSYGCQSAKCDPDPCTGVSCTNPPASYCTNSLTLRSYPSPGTCSSGTCFYTYSDQQCAHGCVSGACCVPESDAAFCAAQNANCGQLSGVDNCGQIRSVASCGTCSNPLVCGGSTPNLCSCAWSSETVATGGAWLQDASMVLDSTGSPQIVYWDQDPNLGTGSLVFAHKVSGAWTQTPLATSVSSQHSGLATDAAGNLHFVYACSYYKFANGAWSSPETYCAPSDGSFGASVVVDSGGTVHVAYINKASPAAIKYAARTSAGWSFETVEASGPSYTTYDDGVSIGLLPGDVPAVAYPSSSAIHYATRTGGVWSTESVVPIPTSYTNLTMEIDSTGLVRLDYDIGYGQQQYAERANGAWSTINTTGWGVLPGGFPGTATIAGVAYSGINNPTPLVLLRETSSGTFSQETIAASTGNSGVNAAIVDGSGTSGTIWILLGGYQDLTLYHRCAYP